MINSILRVSVHDYGRSSLGWTAMINHDFYDRKWEEEEEKQIIIVTILINKRTCSCVFFSFIVVARRQNQFAVDNWRDQSNL